MAETNFCFALVLSKNLSPPLGLVHYIPVGLLTFTWDSSKELLHPIGQIAQWLVQFTMGPFDEYVQKVSLFLKSRAIARDPYSTDHLKG